MSLDWTTFALELLNFGVLVWILRRFLYQPILDVIQARQGRIEAQLRDAEQRQSDAQATREACEARLTAWEQERAGAHAVLEQEIAAERERLLAAVEQDVIKARARHQARQELEREDWQRATERQALVLGGEFMRKLLEKLATPALENRLVTVLLDELERLPSERVARLQVALSEDGLEIVSAFPLGEAQRHALTESLTRLARQPVVADFRQDPAVLCGLRIHAGSWLLAANLQDELKFFQEVAIH